MEHRSTGPLVGLKVVDLSDSLVSAYVGQFLADYGAEVVQIEPPGGRRLRSEAGWPFWARGKKSVELDLHDPGDQAVALELAKDADVVIDAFRPGVADRLGLGYEHLAPDNPGLVYASISGFGTSGPYSRIKGYESIVLAKMGGLSWPAPSGRPGPVMLTANSATMSAAYLAIQGVLVALFERERSGRGQRVDTTLAQGLLAQDPWGWILRVLARRMPDALVELRPQHEEGVSRSPRSWMQFGIIAALSKDGRWMQFGHATAKQFDHFLEAAGLAWIRDDPYLYDAPDSDEDAKREKFWDLLIEGIRAKTFAEWQEIFDLDTNVFAEVFRKGTELLDHPQMQHNGHVLHVDLPEIGPVREPNVLVNMSKTPGDATGPAPVLNQHADELRSRRRTPSPGGPRSDPAPTSPPLDGVTIVELGTFFAAPFGATMLADLGARVIKVEQLDGDPMRWVIPMPESGAVRVTMGKESVAVDFTTEAGRDLVYRLVERADILLQSYRGGVAKRLGYDHETLLKINPRLAYHYGQGYGITGPYAYRPAYNPIIAAGTGFSRLGSGDVPEGPDLTMDEVKDWSQASHGMNAGGPDGFGALGVGIALALNLLARERGAGGQWSLTSMLNTTGHVMADTMIEYEGRPEPPTLDAELYGFHALHRIYPTAAGWVVLRVETQRDWASLVTVLGDAPDLRSDRFSTVTARRAHDAELVAVLTEAFSHGTAEAWERTMIEADVACVAVADGPMTSVFDDGGLAHDLGLVATVEHPLWGEHPRTNALIRFSRSGERLGGSCLTGQHTVSILAELGYTQDEIDQLRADHVVGS